MKTEILSQIQQEQKPWVAHNFGNRPSWMPLLGIVEELGEREEAVGMHPSSEEQRGKIIDALADTMIFVMDYCSALEWDIATLWEAAVTYSYPCQVNVFEALGKIAHAHLKKAQAIRVEENHDAESILSVVHLLANLRWLAWEVDADLVSETYRVWQEVKLRDWKKDPAHAGEKG